MHAPRPCLTCHISTHKKQGMHACRQAWGLQGRGNAHAQALDLTGSALAPNGGMVRMHCHQVVLAVLPLSTGRQAAPPHM